MRYLKRMTAGFGIAGALLVGGACDLSVENPNAPDLPRALVGPVLPAVIGGAYKTWFNTTHDGDFALVLLTMADSYTGSWNNFQMRFYSSGGIGAEPELRPGWENNPASGRRFVIELPWYGYYSALSSANDVLAAIRLEGATVRGDPVQTHMVETAAVLMQGIALSSIALTFDSGFVVDEATDLATLQLSGRQAVRDAALLKLDEAIDLATTGPAFTFPTAWFNGATYTNIQAAQLAATFAARTLAYYPVDAVQNAAVNWDRVVGYAAQGISSTAPFSLIFNGDACGGVGVFSTPSPGDNPGVCQEVWIWTQDVTGMRVDTRVANMLDSRQVHPWGGGSPQPVNPVSPDKRLGDGSFGPDDPDFIAAFGTVPATSQAGTDFAWSSAAIFIPARGQYHQSNIAHIRYEYAGSSALDGSGGGFGPMPTMTATENDLLWAEAILRGGTPGTAAEAAALINKTRVTRGGLSTLTGGEGTPVLLAALQYEQDIELMGIGVVPYFNRRRIEGLQPETPRILPIPAKELGVLAKELYTYGGTGPDY